MAYSSRRYLCGYCKLEWLCKSFSVFPFLIPFTWIWWWYFFMVVHNLPSGQVIWSVRWCASQHLSFVGYKVYELSITWQQWQVRRSLSLQSHNFGCQVAYCAQGEHPAAWPLPQTLKIFIFGYRHLWAHHPRWLVTSVTRLIRWCISWWGALKMIIGEGHIPIMIFHRNCTTWDRFVSNCLSERFLQNLIIVVSTLPVVSPLTTGGKFRRVERRL